MKQESKQSIEQIIDKAVEKSFTAMKQSGDADDGKSFDYYRATESILYNYQKLIDIASDETEYMADIYKQRSKSITSFSSGSGYRDPDEAAEEKEHERQKAFEKTKGQLEFINSILAHFKDDPRYIIIEMYYFGYDAKGRPREKGAKHWSFVDIASQILREDGSCPDEKTVRKWRSQLVSDISVVLFGMPAALSNSLTRTKKV